MQAAPRRIVVSVADQRLDLLEGDALIESFPVSTAANGVGCTSGSMMTPDGRFSIGEKIGEGAPLGMVFKDRLPTAMFGTEDDPDDFVQTRILWLDGLDEHNINTRDRYIYIHGTNHEADIGRPVSHGCIRMRNEDVARLFDSVAPGTPVWIHA